MQLVFPFHHESKRKAMDISFEQRRQLSDAEREEMRNYYKKVQEHFHSLQAYHRLSDDLYHDLLENHYFVEDLYHEALHSLDHPTQEHSHALKDYDHAVREQRSKTAAYHDALKNHLQLIQNNYQSQNLQEQP